MSMGTVTEKSVYELMKMLGKDSDQRFDPFFEFLREKRILSKLSLHDVRQIFNYFKENWRPE